MKNSLHKAKGIENDDLNRPKVGENCDVQENVLLGMGASEEMAPPIIGDRAVLRSGTVIYAGVVIGGDFQTGHSVVIRERTRIGDRVVVGTHSVIDGNVVIGSNVKIQTNVYIPTHTTIGDDVFIGPCVTITNDKYPLRRRDEYEPRGAIIEDSASIGANATLLPGVRIGEGSMVGAGAVVTRDVPPWSLAVGVPARVSPLPGRLRERNRAKGRQEDGR